MPAINIYLDFDLCRKILLRLEKTLVNQVHTGSTKFEFDGYSHEMVGYAVRKLHDVRFIIANNASVWSKDQLRWWPMGFRGRGLEFLAASKDEDAWAEALRVLDEREKTPTIKMLAHYLLDVVQEVAV